MIGGGDTAVDCVGTSIRCSAYFLGFGFFGIVLPGNLLNDLVLVGPVWVKVECDYLVTLDYYFLRQAQCSAAPQVLIALLLILLFIYIYITTVIIIIIIIIIILILFVFFDPPNRLSFIPNIFYSDPLPRTIFRDC